MERLVTPLRWGTSPTRGPPEKNYTQGGVLPLLVFVKIYCPLQKDASALLRAAHAKLISSTGYDFQ